MAQKKAKSSGKGVKRVAQKKQKPVTKTAKKQSSLKAHDIVFENVHRAKIRVIGIGGGAGNIVTEVASRVQRFDFLGANTDAQALRELSRKVKSVPFGHDFTHGLGCGMDAELAERAAKAEKEKIKKVLEGSDICIFIASLGGGTGSGATPVFAEIAHELRILTIGIFTMPFSFEGDKRKQIADTALEKVKPFLNTYVVIPNENIFRIIDSKTPLKMALSGVNKRLADTLEGFIETLSSPGLINIDFADVRSVLEGRGRLGFIHTADATGNGKAEGVVKQVLSNPLYEYGIDGADRMLFNIMGDRNLKMQEVAQVSKAISDYNPKARIIFGVSCSNAKLKNTIRVTLFAVGCGAEVRDHVVQGSRSEEKHLPKKKKKALARVKHARKRLSRATQQPQGEQEEAYGTTEEVSGQLVRRNAVELKKAVDDELQEMEKKERQWDIPAFLRNR